MHSHRHVNDQEMIFIRFFQQSKYFHSVKMIHCTYICIRNYNLPISCNEFMFSRSTKEKGGEGKKRRKQKRSENSGGEKVGVKERKEKLKTRERKERKKREGE